VSNLQTAESRAQRVTGPKSAARLYNDLEYELAFSDNEEDYERGERALRELEQRFPGIERQAREITDPPKLSRRAGENLHGGRQHHAPLQAKPRRQAQAAARAGAGSPLARATTIHARRRSTAGWAGRRFQQTGIPGASESAAQLTMRTIGWIAGLSFLYLILQPRGSNAVSSFFSTATTAFRGFASPNVDPLQKSTYALARPGALHGHPLIGKGSALSGAANSAAAAVDASTAAFLRHAGTGAHKPNPANPINQAASKAAAHIGASL
jgi:hypothetical protein